jgi:ferritin
MTYIKKLAEQIKDEIESAMTYAEKSLYLKAKDETSLASKYKSMAEDELSHAMTIHTEAVQEIEKLSKVYPNPPIEMMEKWEHEHKEFIEKVAQIRHLLSM